MKKQTLVALVLAVASGTLLGCGGDSSTGGSPDGGMDGTGSDGGGMDSTTPTDSGSRDSGVADTSRTDGPPPGDSASGDAPASDTGTSDSATMDTGTPGDAGPCGTCPTGFTCGAGGYCVNANGVPAFDHVYVIVMENRSLSSIMGSSSAPYINMLMSTYSYATNYTTSVHPSLPNYIEMTSGSSQNITCDCQPVGGSACIPVACLIDPACLCDVPDAAMGPTHLGDQLDTANVTWREYAEDANGPCDISGDHGNYARKHVPFLYYDDVQMNVGRCNREVRPYTDFAADLGTYGYSLISPNLCDDMHDTCAPLNDAIKQGDTWLSTNVPPILATAGFQPGGKDVLFIAWDEEDGSVGSAPILFIAISPLVKLASTTAAAYTHLSLLATIEETFGVSHLNMASMPINDIWK